MKFTLCAETGIVEDIVGYDWESAFLDDKLMAQEVLSE
jgi:hypothetical protein